METGCLRSWGSQAGLIGHRSQENAAVKPKWPGDGRESVRGKDSLAILRTIPLDYFLPVTPVSSSLSETLVTDSSGRMQAFCPSGVQSQSLEGGGDWRSGVFLPYAGPSAAGHVGK